MRFSKTFSVLFLVCAFIIMGVLTFFIGTEIKISQKKLETLVKNLGYIEKQILPDGLYDFNDLLTDPNDDFSAVQNSFVSLVTRTKFENLNEGEEPIEKLMINNGFVVVFPKGKGFPAGKYILTLDHAVSRHKISSTVQVVTPFGTQFVEIENDKRISEKTYLLHKGKEVEIKELINDFDTDIALFKLSDDIDIPCFPYEFGNNDELKVGHRVYVLGRPGVFAEIVPRKGFVSSKKGFYHSKILTEKYGIPEIKFRHGAPCVPEWMFSVTAGINHGDSGLPVVALRDGKYELVGLAQGTRHAQKLDVALRINFMLDEIKKMLKS